MFETPLVLKQPGVYYGTNFWKAVRKMRKKRIACLVLVLLLIAAAAFAGSVNGWGQQERGSAGKNAQLKGEPFTVPNGVAGTISSVSCDGDGFWIEGPMRRNFVPASTAQGVQLKAGTYYVYPNLKHGQQMAKVSVKVSW